jgi:putative membrane protein
MKKLLKLLQSMLALGIAMFFANLWATRKLAYFINQRFFLLIILAVFLLSLASATVYASQLSPNDKGKSSNQKWIIIYLIPVFTSLIDSPVFLNVLLFALVFILGVTRVNVMPENESVADRKENKTLFSSLVVISIPLLIGLFTPQKPLSTETITTRGMNYTMTYSDNNVSVPSLQLNSSENDELDWLEILTSSNPAQFEGSEIQLIGFVYHNEEPETNHFMLGRYVVTCCVADAFAVGFNIEWPQSASIADNQWVEITGIIDSIDSNGQKPLHIRAYSVTEIDPLQQPYLYP